MINSFARPHTLRALGQALSDHADVNGVVFTGSKEVGLKLLRGNAGRATPRPVITELGGKNPAIVMPSADLDKASDGVMRSAEVDRLLARPRPSGRA